jgi:DNA ligase (NAD+)
MLFARRFVRPRLAFFSSSRKKVDNAGEIVALRSLLKQWSDAYYNSSAPLVTDEQFDALRERLLALDPRAVDFVGASPTALGAPRHKHATPMLSLQSTRQLEELDDFRDSTIRFLETTSELVWATEFKYDGMALALHYDEKGKLVRAVTRGDGEVGEEVPLDRLIGASLPARIDTSVLDEACEVRGEVVLSRCQFDAVSEELGYKSARNAVVGIIRNEKPPDKRLQLAFVAYGVESAKVRNADYHVRVGLLKQLGFSPCAHLFVHTSWNSVIKEVKRGIDLRGKLDFETDGIVIKLNSRTQSDSLGSTRHHPKHSIAFKWSSLHLPVTSIKDIEWQVDQRGCLRPVALVVPAVVCDDGATISRASLHNWSFVERHRLQPGVPVQMERAGGTVPHLIPLPVSSSSPPVSPPSHCPCPVRAAVVSDPPLHLKCSRAAACPERIAYCAFAVASVFGVKGLGLISARQMSHAGLLSKDNPWAVMSLSQEQLESIGQGWGPKKGAKLAQEIDDRVRAATYEQILASLCVSGVKKKKTKKDKISFSQKKKRLVLRLGKFWASLLVVWNFLLLLPKSSWPLCLAWARCLPPPFIVGSTCLLFPSCLLSFALLACPSRQQRNNNNSNKRSVCLVAACRWC